MNVYGVEQEYSQGNDDEDGSQNTRLVCKDAKRRMKKQNKKRSAAEVAAAYRRTTHAYAWIEAVESSPPILEQLPPELRELVHVQLQVVRLWRPGRRPRVVPQILLVVY
jgi:hypothetical protein